MSAKKQIFVIGLGLGGKRLVTRQESAALKAAQLFIGEGDALDAAKEYAGEAGRLVRAEKPAEIRRVILEAEEERIAVLTEGDPGTSGELDALMPSIRDLKPVVIPGVSLESYVAARTGISCAGADSVDMKTGVFNMAELLRLHGRLLIRTHGDTRPLLRGLAAAGHGNAAACLLEYPAQAGERISSGAVKDFIDRQVPNGSALFLMRPAADAVNRAGLPDSSYSGVGVLPGEVRAVLLSRLALKEKDVVYIIGAGAGDAVVEAAAAARLGTVYAIDSDSSAAQRTLENCRRFGSRNVRLVEGIAPSALGHLEPADAVLLRGTGEKTGDLIQIVLSRNPAARVAMVTRTMENALQAAEELESRGLAAELLQMTGSRGRQEGEGHTLSPAWSYYLVTAIRS